MGRRRWAFLSVTGVLCGGLVGFAVRRRSKEASLSGCDAIRAFYAGSGDLLALGRADPSRGIALVHVPKTGGTALKHLDPLWSAATDEARSHHKPSFGGCTCSGWHIPPRYLKQQTGAMTMCVAREPLERLVSEFRFRARGTDLFDTQRLDKWLREKVFAKKKCPALDCHLLPAFKYAWDAQGRRTCDHVLDYATLAPDFNLLMAAYNRTDRLIPRSSSRRRRRRLSNNTVVGVGDVEPGLANELRCAYSRDICLFGYAPASSCEKQQ